MINTPPPIQYFDHEYIWCLEQRCGTFCHGYGTWTAQEKLQFPQAAGGGLGGAAVVAAGDQE